MVALIYFHSGEGEFYIPELCFRVKKKISNLPQKPRDRGARCFMSPGANPVPSVCPDECFLDKTKFATTVLAKRLIRFTPNFDAMCCNIDLKSF